MSHNNWYVAYTYPKSEKKVHARIQDSGYQSFLPLQKVRRVWSDRIKMVEVPLFTSYIFVFTRVQNIPRLSDIPGIARFVSFENEYAKIRDTEIDLIKDLIANGKDIDIVRNGFSEGQKVRIKEGPFVGLEGLLVKKEGKSRFVLEIEGLKKLLSVNIPTLYLEKIG